MLLLSVRTEHPFYLTTCQIEIAPDGSWSGELRIFYDDLEDALHNHQGWRPNLQLGPEHHHESIERYLQHKLIFVAGRRLEFVLHQSAIDVEVVVLQIRGKQDWPQTCTHLEISLLTEIFESHKTIVVLRTGSQSKLYQFSRKDTRQEVGCKS